MSDRYCDIDAFAATLSDLLLDTGDDVTDAANKALAQSARRGAKFAKDHASKGGVHDWSGAYVSGFSSHVNKTGLVAEAEVGNKSKPGLVHLLEKGHNTLTGRRTRAFPHMAPAFEEMQEDFVQRMDQYVGEALS